MIIDISVLSEYLNRYARYEWDAYEKDKTTKEHFRRFKDFRDSAHFKPIAETASFFASKIISRCKQQIQLLSAGMTFDITHVLDDYAAVKCDFTDAVLAETCHLSRCKLVTNDKDFKQIDYDIEIITHNPILLTQ